MKLKTSGNRCYEPHHAPFYLAAANVARGSEYQEERLVGELATAAISNAVLKDANALDSLMQSLARFDAATKRIREELRAIHE